MLRTTNSNGAILKVGDDSDTTILKMKNVLLIDGTLYLDCCF